MKIYIAIILLCAISLPTSVARGRVQEGYKRPVSSYTPCSPPTPSAFEDYPIHSPRVPESMRHQTYNNPNDANYKKEREDYREKLSDKQTIANLTAQVSELKETIAELHSYYSLSEKALDKQYGKLGGQYVQLETRMKELESNVVDLTLLNDKVTRRAEYYEAYARTLHNQLIKTPSAFKPFDASAK